MSASTTNIASGEVNGGWRVLREALNDEHGTVERDADGLDKVAAMTEHALLLAEAADRVAALADYDESARTSGTSVRTARRRSASRSSNAINGERDGEPEPLEQLRVPGEAGDAGDRVAAIAKTITP